MEDNKANKHSLKFTNLLNSKKSCGFSYLPQSTFDWEFYLIDLMVPWGGFYIVLMLRGVLLAIFAFKYSNTAHESWFRDHIILHLRHANEEQCQL